MSEVSPASGFPLHATVAPPSAPSASLRAAGLPPPPAFGPPLPVGGASAPIGTGGANNGGAAPALAGSARPIRAAAQIPFSRINRSKPPRTPKSRTHRARRAAFLDCETMLEDLHLVAESDRA